MSGEPEGGACLICQSASRQRTGQSGEGVAPGAQWQSAGSSPSRGRSSAASGPIGLTVSSPSKGKLAHVV